MRSNIAIIEDSRSPAKGIQMPAKNNTADSVPLDVDSPVFQPPLNTRSIPKRIILNHKTNILETKTPKYVYDNLQNTIQIYAQAWNQTLQEIEILFLDDKSCRRLIEKVEPRLLKPFDTEIYGAYKSDICRTVAVYEHGGYYFDNDLQVLQALIAPKDIDIATGDSLNGQFYNALILSAAGNPILRATLDSMIHDWYYNQAAMAKFNVSTFNHRTFFTNEFLDEVSRDLRQRIKGLDLRMCDVIMGPLTLRRGYDQHKDSINAWLLHEIENKQLNLYPDLLRNRAGVGCNFLVHDNATHTPYFYSRCIGTNMCPANPNLGTGLGESNGYYGL